MLHSSTKQTSNSMGVGKFGCKASKQLIAYIVVYNEMIVCCFFLFFTVLSLGKTRFANYRHENTLSNMLNRNVS